jgi:hypothetical protein
MAGIPGSSKEKFWRFQYYWGVSGTVNVPESLKLQDFSGASKILGKSSNILRASQGTVKIQGVFR